MGISKKRKVPVIYDMSQISKLQDIDPKADIVELHPLYQNGKLVAYRKTIWLSPAESGEGWGLQRFVKLEDRVLGEVFPE
jgi:hypothetical protein